MAESLKKKVLESKRYTHQGQGVRDFFLIAATFDERGRIIAIGENTIKTHPMMKKWSLKTNLKHKIHLHAEISALVRSYRPSYSLMVIRLNRKGEFAMAKPCPLCLAAILDARVKHLYYSDQDGDIVSLKYSSKAQKSYEEI